MSQYEIDLRLPIGVWRRAPFIIVGHDFKFLPLGVLADYLQHGGKQLPRINPLVLSKTDSKGLKQDVVFCFVFFYVNDRYERVMFMTHPIDMGSVNHEALEALLGELLRIARLLDCHIVEAELNDLVEGSVAFPTSLSSISYDVEAAEMVEDGLEVFRRDGFNEWAEVECFEHNVKELEGELRGMTSLQDRVHITQVGKEDYLKLVGRMEEMETRSFRLPSWDGSNSATPFNFQIFNDSAYILRKAPRFGFLKSLELGFIRFIPNLIEPLKHLRTPHLLLFSNALEEYPYDAAKIVEWGLGSDNQLFDLLQKATEAMGKRRIVNIQFANVSSKQTKMKVILKELGFKLVHRVKMLRREVD